jgi:hypothetical protein
VICVGDENVAGETRSTVKVLNPVACAVGAEIGDNNKLRQNNEIIAARDLNWVIDIFYDFLTNRVLKLG